MNNDWRNSLQSLLDCGDLPQGEDAVQSAEASTKPAAHSKLTVSLEKKGRAGKTATIISGFAPEDDIAAIASTLKTKLATGGSARGGEILIQGDRQNDVRRLLKEMGYK